MKQGIQASREALILFAEIRLTQGIEQALIRDMGIKEGQIIAQGGMEELDVLRDQGDRAT